MAVIQANGDRHYETEHGVYVIINCMDGYSFDVKVWEIFSPEGFNFTTAHSLIEYSLADAKAWVGGADNECDDKCGCEYFEGVVVER